MPPGIETVQTLVIDVYRNNDKALLTNSATVPTDDFAGTELEVWLMDSIQKVERWTSASSGSRSRRNSMPSSSAQVFASFRSALLGVLLNGKRSAKNQFLGTIINNAF